MSTSANMEQAAHEEIRGLYRPGDPIFFGGRGPVSWTIKKWTRSRISHVGVVSHVEVVGEGKRRVHVVEATSLDGRAGVISTPLSDRIAKYDGEVWAAFLDDEHRAMLAPHLPEAWKWLDGHVRRKTKYDTWGAVRCTMFPQRNDDDYLYCSETVAGFWRHGTVIPTGSNPSAWSPRDTAEARLFHPTYYQLINGRKRFELRHFNTRTDLK